MILKAHNGRRSISHCQLSTNIYSAAQQIKFAKMPVRTRSGSSPIRKPSITDSPKVLVTSPSRRSTEGKFRRGSLGAVEAVKQRARRDTTTSSEVSSENDLDPSVFQRRQINPPRTAQHNSILTEKREKSEQSRPQERTRSISEDSGEESDEASLSSDFAEVDDSESLLDEVTETLTSSPTADMPPGLTINPPSPKKTRTTASNVLQALPPPRPISTIQPVSILGQAIRARRAKPDNPLESFARLSGKGVPDPLNIRIYAPFSVTSNKPFEMPLQRTVQEGNSSDKVQVTVADAIGLSLWRYQEEGMKPALSKDKMNVNRWTFRMVDDGEVEYDFPALGRTSAISDFTYNNNRAAAARGRSRGKAVDEFALVEATEVQVAENQRLTPKYTQQSEPAEEDSTLNGPQSTATNEVDASNSTGAQVNGGFDRPFAFTTRKQSTTLADKPAVPTVHSTPRMGPPKLLKIHFTSLEAYTTTNTVEVTTDTYIAEVLENVCKRWNLDKAHHFFRVSGTTTVAPLDRTVESIGNRMDLDLVRRRFPHDGGFGGLTGSPTSSSPSAPLLLQTTGTPTKKGKKGGAILPSGAHPLSQKQDLWGNTANYKKYTVVRKQPMSFTSSHQRTLLMDNDYMHILPSETDKTLFNTSAKTTTVPFSMIVGCKVSRRHPKTFRVIIFRERETKRYDFEAQNVVEAAEIVEEIRKGMEPFHPMTERV